VTRLVRGLGPWGAASLVVGTIIGTGVFLKTASMAQVGGSALWVLVAWAAAGALSFVGALTYAELGGMFPAAGGEYVYLRRGYGPLLGYLYAWNRFWIATPASIAAYAVGSATFIGVFAPTTSYVVDLPFGELPATKVAAVGFVAVFTGLNCMNVRAGGSVQTVMTIVKVLILAGIAVGAFVAPSASFDHVQTGDTTFPGASAFGAMVVSALWAYDGWNNLPMAAGEVRDPQRNVPRAIVLGTLVVLVTYAVINIGYFVALPFDDVAASSSTKYPDAPAVAAKVASQFLGATTAALLAAAMALSALSAMNGSMLTGARVPFAVARDRLAPGALARISERTRVPTTAIVIQSMTAVGFCIAGGFDELTDGVVFSSWLFYALNAGSVLLLRRREPSRARSFRAPGVPVVPVLFVICAAWLIFNFIDLEPVLSGIVLGWTAIGLVLFLALYRGKARPLVDEDESAHLGE
jgi:basic amino acid/polyamine antiporter, APA family